MLSAVVAHLAEGWSLMLGKTPKPTDEILAQKIKKVLCFSTFQGYWHFSTNPLGYVVEPFFCVFLHYEGPGMICPCCRTALLRRGKLGGFRAFQF